MGYDTTEATDGLLEEFGPLAIGGGWDHWGLGN